MAKLKKNSTHKKSAVEGIEAAGGVRKKKTMNKNMDKALKIVKGHGKKMK